MKPFYRIDHHWHIHSSGVLPDGSRVFVILISRGNWSRLETCSALLVDKEGLWRLYRGGRKILLAPGFEYPTEKSYNSELVLREFAQKHWGTQRGSVCVQRSIPEWLIKRSSKDLAHLLASWFRSEQRAKFDYLCRGQWAERTARAVSHRPVAITTIPSTDVLIRALHDGTLLARLKLGLERIYVSSYALIRAPSIETAVRALEQRFPERLVIAPVNLCDQVLIQRGLGITKPRAIEYVFVGNSLAGAYQDDFDFDKLDNPRALDDVFRFRIGDIPRGTKILFMRELKVEYDAWKSLDIDAMREAERRSMEVFRKQEKKAVDLLFPKESS